MKNISVGARILALLLAVLTAFSLVVFLASCDKKLTSDAPVSQSAAPSDPSEEDDVSGKWDYVRDPSLPDFATQVQLKNEGLDSDFDVTGRGYVTVEQFIDGDTVHFWNNSKTTVIKARFLAIDTPESTGRVEPWGKPASNFTKNRLKNAEAIVLESDTEGKINMDSTGARYLCWVWYRNKNELKWRNLNIELLSEGLAMGKSSSSTRYGEVAAVALTSARAEGLNLYSGKRDPLFFYGETVDLSIKSLVLNKETYNGIKVRFEGLVTKESGGGIYVESFDDDTQQYYGVYVYGGFSALAPKFLVPGYRLRITGTADNNENFGFQVSGLSFSLVNPTDNDVKILEKDVEVKPTLVTGEDVRTNETLESTYVRVENLKVTKIYTTTAATSTSKGAMTLTCTDTEGKIVSIRTVVLMQDGVLVTASFFEGKTISVNGVIEYYEGNPQVKLFSTSDVTFAA